MGKTHWSVRALSLTLAICLLLGTVPAGTFTLPVFAAESSSASDTTTANVTKIRSYAQNLLNTNFDTAKSEDASTHEDSFTWDTEANKKTNWRYYNGVMLDALLMFGVDSDAGNALEFAKTFLDTNVDDSGSITHYIDGELDSVPPALTLLTILDSAGVDEATREDYETAIHWVYRELEAQTAYEQCGGNLLHKQDASKAPTSGWKEWNIALDGLYMSEPFLMEYANALASGKISNPDNVNPSEIYEEVYERFMWVAEYMYDSATGLYHHAWDVTRSKGNGVFWGRAIGWYAVGLVEVIDRMPEGTYKDNLIVALEKLFDGMLLYQDSTTGMWRNVVNNTSETITYENTAYDNKLETSVTSLMSYALLKAYNEGWTGGNKYGTAGLRAFNGIVANKLSSDGTTISDTYLKSGADDYQAYYCMNGYKDNEAKGIGAVLMAASIANDVAKKLNNEAADAETFTTGVVYAPYASTVAQSEDVYVLSSCSDVKVTLLGNKGTVLTISGDDSRLSYAVTKPTKNDTGKTSVTVSFTENGNTIEIGTIQVNAPSWVYGTYTYGETSCNTELWLERTCVYTTTGTYTYLNAYTTLWGPDSWIGGDHINEGADENGNYIATYNIVSSDENIVKYENGGLVAKGVGTATVAVSVTQIQALDGAGINAGTYTVSSTSETITVVVTEPVSHSVGLSVTPGTIEVGDTATLVGAASASDGVDHTYTYTYSVANGTGTATVSGNTLTATAEGTVDVTVTATADDSSSVSKTVTLAIGAATVEDTALSYTVKDEDGVALDGKDVTLAAGETFTPNFTVMQGGTDVTGVYTMVLSENSEAIEISGTTITANEVDEDTTVPVTATFAQGAVAATAEDNIVTFNVTVTAETGGELTFKNNQTTYSTKISDIVGVEVVGDTADPEADIDEDPYKSQAKWEWSSSDPSVATLINHGRYASVIGHKEGTVTVTVSSKTYGSTGSVTVTVSANSSIGTGTKTYYLDTNGIDVGDKYIIVHSDGTNHMSAFYPDTETWGVLIGAPVTLNEDGTELTIDSYYASENSHWTFSSATGTLDGFNPYYITSSGKGSYLRSDATKIVTGTQTVTFAKHNGFGEYVISLNADGRDLRFDSEVGGWLRGGYNVDYGIYLYKEAKTVNTVAGTVYPVVFEQYTAESLENGVYVIADNTDGTSGDWYAAVLNGNTGKGLDAVSGTFGDGKMTFTSGMPTLWVVTNKSGNEYEFAAVKDGTTYYISSASYISKAAATTVVVAAHNGDGYNGVDGEYRIQVGDNAYIIYSKGFTSNSRWCSALFSQEVDTSSPLNISLTAEDVTLKLSDAESSSVVAVTANGSVVSGAVLSYAVTGAAGIVTVDPLTGKLSPVATGVTQVTATLQNVTVDGTLYGPSETVSVTYNVRVLSGYTVTIDSPAEGAVLNMAMDYTATCTLGNSENTYVRWWVSDADQKVLTVDNLTGEITLVGPGTATITASIYRKDTNDWIDANDTVTVTVKAPTISIDDVVLVNGQTGGILNTVVSFNGETVTDTSEYTIEYAVTNGSSVTVGTDGSLTTVGKGTSTVTVCIKNADGTVVASDTAIVEVIYITKAELNKNSFTLYEGEALDAQTLQDLVLTVHWSDGPSETVTCNSPDVDIGDVNLSGPGTYVVPITYTKHGESVTVNVQVEVKEMPTGLDWQPLQHEYKYYQRVNSIESGKGYVFGLVSSDGNTTLGSSVYGTGQNDPSYVILPINAGWTVDKAENTYLNLGDPVVEWYFEEAESENHYIYYVDENGTKQYLRRQWDTDNKRNSQSLLTDLKNQHTTAWICTLKDGMVTFQTAVNSFDLMHYSNNMDAFAMSGSDLSQFYLYSQNGNSTMWTDMYAALKGNKVFDYIHGEVTAVEILKQVQDSYDVFLADDQNGTNETHLPWSSDRISYEWVDSNGNTITDFDPDNVGQYYLYVLVDGQRVHTSGIDVQIHKDIDHWALNQTEITVPLNGELDISELIATAYDANGTMLLTLQGEQIDFDFAGATLNGEPAAVNTSNKNATYLVPVQYNGVQVYTDAEKTKPLTLTVRISDDPYYDRDTATEYAGYPAEGSVKFDKNVFTDGTYYNQTGVAQLELTAAGVTASSAVDVVLIVDISNSMAWTDQWFVMPESEANYHQDFQDYLEAYNEHGDGTLTREKLWANWSNGVDITYTVTTTQEDGTEKTETKVAHTGATDYVKIAIDANGVPNVETKLDQAMESASAFADILLGSNSGNTLSFVTFAGMDHQHNTGRDTIDSVHSVFIGVSDAAKAKVSFDGTQFYKLTPKGTSVEYELTLTDADGHILASGLNRGNTNYDYAFGQAYEAVVALKAQMAAKYGKNTYEETGRQLHVVFMTDGAPSHYNGRVYNTSTEHSDRRWGTTTPYSGDASYTDASWLSHIQSYNVLATKLVEEGGLDGFHAVGFDMAHGGFVEHVWQKDDLLGVISGLIRNQVVDVMDATSGAELLQYYKDLAAALTYSGTDAQVTDTIGSNFTLFTGVENEQTVYSDDVQQPPSDMWIKSYRLVTMADVGKTLWLEGEEKDITLTADNIESYLGKRVMKLDTDGNTYVYDCEDLEHLTFTFNTSEPDEQGMTQRSLVSYTTTNLKTGETKTVDYAAKGDINGYYFSYTIDANGKETVEWTIGDITDREIALSYYVYLKGSMDDSMERPGGSYDTNEIATLEYVDNQGRHAARDYKIPNLPWQEASVTVRFYLVNDKGEYVNFAGTAFESESLRVFLAESYVYSGLELSGVNNFTSEQAYADAKVTKYPLYDKAVALTVYRNPSSEGNAFGSGYTVVNQSGKKDSQSLIKFVDTYGDGSYVKTVIEIPVVLTEDLGESLRPLASAMVVVDYGKPIDIDVISDDEATYYETGIRAQDIKDGEYYWYRMEIIGFATYSELHDQKDYVREDSISNTLVTEYGIYELVKDRGADLQVRFTPTRFFEDPENVFVGIKFAKYTCVADGSGGYIQGEATTDYFCMYKQLSVVPATVMYYETDFADNAFILHQGEQIQGMNFKAQLGFASDGWGYNDWNNAKATAQIKGPGTYTITLTPSQTVKGIEVLYVDIEGAAEALANYTISNVSMSVTGTNGNSISVEVDQNKVWVNTYGNAKRLCLYNAAWPDTSEDETVYLNPNAIGNLADTEFTSLTVTFTLSENNTASENETQTSALTDGNADWTTEADPTTGNMENVGTEEYDHIQNEGPRGEGAQGTEVGYAYGFDTTYSEDNYLSDGDSWFVKGASTAEEIRNNDPSTYATFTFTGTGFDLISRTGIDQATLRVHVYQGAEISGDPYKIISVIDKGANELYQIPVISVKDMPHGTYTVQIIVYESFTAENLPVELKEQMARGNEFYFDAVRIYDPVAPETVITQDKDGVDITVDKVYSEDGENEPVIIQIGDLLMDLETFETLGQGAEGTGAVYMDAHTLADGNWVATDMVQQYKDYGPNNEVYLYPGQGIAFILNISDTIPASIQIGAKSIEGNSPTMRVEVSSVTTNDKVLNASLTQTVTTSTAMYYKAAYGTGLANLFGENKQVYVFIWNNSTDASKPILSITDIKIGYASEAPIVPVSIGSSHQLVESAAGVMVGGSRKLVRINDEWCYCEGETVLTNYTGLVVTAGAGTWYVKNGKVDFTYNGMYEDTQNAKLYYIRGGMVDETLDGIASRNGQWMYFEDGVVDTTRTGIVTYGSTGNWYVQNGVVQMDFSGTVTIGNTIYTISNGKVVTDTNS